MHHTKGIFLLVFVVIFISHKGYTAGAAPAPLAFNRQLFSAPAPGPLMPGMAPLFPEVLAGHPQIAPMYHFYNNVAVAFGSPTIVSPFQDFYIKAIDNMGELRNSLYIPQPAGASPTPHTEIQRLLNIMYVNITQFVGQNIPPVLSRTHLYVSLNFQSIFSSLITDIRKRYALAKIEAKHATGEAFLGDGVITPLPAGAGPGNGIPRGHPPHHNLLRDTFKILSGRIFMVKPAAAIGEDKVLSVATGFLFPESVSASPTASRVLTCIHCIKSFEQMLQGPDIEVYFIRTEALDRNLGVPTNAKVQAVIGYVPVGAPVLPAYTQEQFIKYLRTASLHPANNDVRRIERFQPLNHTAEFDLRHHLPNFHYPRQDSGFGILNRPYIFHNQVLATIKVPKGNHIVPPDRYFALGYAVFSHHSLIPTIGLHKAPLTLTQETVAGAPININQMLEHGATISNGMSGGPLFYIHGNTINIIGAIQGFTANLNRYNASLL